MRQDHNEMGSDMKAEAVVRAHIDAATKGRAAVALDAMRLSVSDAIRLLMQRIAAEQRLPFDVSVPASETVKAIAELDAGEGARFDTPEKLLADLDI